jgi:biopolymer transport protein TolR
VSFKSKGLSSSWKKSGSKKKSGDISLNITAMADIFVVLLVFLLKSYATGAMAVTTTAELNLPMAKNQNQAVEATKIEISATHLVVEGQPIVELQDFKFPMDDLLPVGISKKLFETLKEHKEKSLDPENTNVIILADKDVPYSSLKVILTSAAGSGLTNFKLAVMGIE